MFAFCLFYSRCDSGFVSSGGGFPSDPQVCIKVDSICQLSHNSGLKVEFDTRRVWACLATYQHRSGSASFGPSKCSHPFHNKYSAELQNPIKRSLWTSFNSIGFTNLGTNTFAQLFIYSFIFFLSLSLSLSALLCCCFFCFVLLTYLWL